MLRQKLEAFDQRLSKDVMRTIDEVKRWKVAGMTVIGMVGIAGASIGAFAFWAWDIIVSRWQGGP